MNKEQIMKLIPAHLWYAGKQAHFVNDKHRYEGGYIEYEAGWYTSDGRPLVAAVSSDVDTMYRKLYASYLEFLADTGTDKGEV